MNYPSGKKSVLVTSKPHQVICKAIVDNKDGMDNTIVSTLCNSNPKAVIEGVKKLIEAESSSVCRRGSGTALQQKQYEDYLNFSWETVQSDLQNRCPNIMSIINAMVHSPPPVIREKAFFHVMFSSAIGLHGRSQEMSSLHYMVAFILARGGCTQRVSVNVTGVPMI